MHKPTIMVTRTGSPCYVNNKGSKPRGDLDTDPLIRYLALRDDINVVYFGVIRNAKDLPENVSVINVPVQHIDYLLTGRDIEKIWADSLHELREMNPVGCIEMFGATPSWSWVDNPNGAMTQDFAVKYSLPPLWAMHKLDIPRYGVVTDPKCYKRDLEMVSCWKNIVPRAVLSQEDTVIKRKMNGYPVEIEAVYAACEFWLTTGFDQYSHRGEGHVVCANTHHKAYKGREELWWEILMRCPEATKLCGQGWDKISVPNHVTNCGIMPDLEATLAFIRSGEEGVCIPQKPGFNTTKPRLYALQNTVPRLFGNGKHEWTYDRDERILPLNHPARFDSGQPYDHDEVIQMILDKTTPDFSKLDRLIDSILDGRDHTTAEWRQEFGGYYIG